MPGDLRGPGRDHPEIQPLTKTGSHGLIGSLKQASSVRQCLPFTAASGDRGPMSDVDAALAPSH